MYLKPLCRLPELPGGGACSISSAPLAQGADAGGGTAAVKSCQGRDRGRAGTGERTGWISVDHL